MTPREIEQWTATEWARRITEQSAINAIHRGEERASARSAFREKCAEREEASGLSAHEVFDAMEFARVQARVCGGVAGEQKRLDWEGQSK